LRSMRFKKDFDGWLVQVKEIPRDWLVQHLLQEGAHGIEQQSVQWLQNNPNFAMGEVENDRQSGLMSSLLYERNARFTNSHGGCGKRLVKYEQKKEKRKSRNAYEVQ
jgi:hypothetical protein